MNLNSLGLFISRAGNQIWSPFWLFTGGYAGFLGDPLVTGQVVGGAIAEITNQANPTPNATQATSTSKPTQGEYPRDGIRNRILNMMVGAVAGSPGTLPPPYFVGNLRGLTQTLSAIDTATGKMRFRLSGTPSSTGRVGLFYSLASINAAVGQVWTNSVILSVAAGALTNTEIYLQCDEYNSSAVFLGTVGNTPITPNGTATRYEAALTLAQSTTAFASGCINVSVTSGMAVDLTLEIERPQWERAAAASAIQNVTSAYQITESGVPSVQMPYYDGGDFLTFGVQSFGTASLFAGAGQAWSVGGVFRTTTIGVNTMLAKASATEATRTFQFLCVGTTGMLIYIRGGQTLLGGGSLKCADGAFHSWLVVWDGSALTVKVDGVAYAASVGSASVESENILVGVRTESSPSGYWVGFNHCELMIDRALSATEQSQFFAQCARTYGTPN